MDAAALSRLRKQGQKRLMLGVIRDKTLAAEFIIKHKNMDTFSSTRDHMIPERLKCTHSATKKRTVSCSVTLLTISPVIL